MRRVIAKRRKRRSIVGDVVFAAFVALMTGAAILMRLGPESAEASTTAHETYRDSFLPLAPFNPLGPGARLARLARDPAACRAALAQTTLVTAPIADNHNGSCGFSNAVTIQQAGYEYSTPAQLSCGMANAVAVWEREVAQAALRYLSSPVVEIQHYGTYSCRRIYHQPKGPMSEHATANAIDVAAFRLEDGSVISVKNDWGKGTLEAQFLNEVRNRSCGVFSTVLSPDYNRAHADHFHLDMGGGRVCR